MRIKITLPQGYENDKGDKGQYGEVVDFLPDLAVKLIRLNMAIPAPEPVVETAESVPPENAAKRTTRPKSRTTKR